MNEKIIALLIIGVLVIAGIAIATFAVANVQANEDVVISSNVANNRYCSGLCFAEQSCGNPSCGVEETGSCECGR